MPNECLGGKGLFRMETLVPRRTFVIKFDGCRTELGAAERSGTARRTFVISALSDDWTVFV